MTYRTVNGALLIGRIMAYYANLDCEGNMPTRNVVLTEHQEKLIEALVGSGRYQNASEVMREGLRLVESREAEEAAKLEALRSAARVGLEAIERGDYQEFPDGASLSRYLQDVAQSVLSETRGK